MIVTRNILQIFLLSACALLMPDDANAQPANLENSYRIFCRTGGTMSYLIQSSSAVKGSRFTINFQRSPRKYEIGKNKLQPGECAYATRAIRDDEPRKMGFRTIVGLEVRVSSDVSGGYTLGVEYTNPANFADPQEYWDVKRFIRTLNTDEYFTVEVAKLKSSIGGYYITKLY